jgi:hypothetical protein
VVGDTYVCNMTTPLPVTINARWMPPTLPSAQLVPRPMMTPNTNASRGLNPPPVQDCTDMSFTHPDWVLDNVVYVSGQQPMRPNIKTSSFNFTLTSRVTGVRMLCQWEGALGDETFVADKGLMLLACSSSQGGPDLFRSRDKVVSEYSMALRQLRIRHEWICGDIQGSHFTEFSAKKSLAMPFYCADDGGSTCRTNRLTIRGDLTKPVSLGTPETNSPPPPNMNNPGCTANSGAPTWTVTKFWFNQTRFGRTQGNQSLASTEPQSRIIEFEIRNLANQYTTNCVIADRALDDVTDRWFRCGPENSAQYELETYVKFNVSEAVVYFNQTWFCSDTDPAAPYVYNNPPLI